MLLVKDSSVLLQARCPSVQGWLVCVEGCGVGIIILSLTTAYAAACMQCI